MMLCGECDMHIPIPIPIGTKHVAAVQGAVWKFVSCAHCQQRYAYLLELQATGEDYDPLFLDGEGSAERARAKAEQNLLQKSRNVVLPVPCPNCGTYQADMSQMLREEASINSFQIAGLLIAVISLVPLAFGIPYIWVVTIVLAAVGLALVAYGYVVAFRFEPNAGDSGPRKAVGQRHAIWGEQLAELLAASPNAEPAAPADGGRDAGS
jgi:hypothetical protein